MDDEIQEKEGPGGLRVVIDRGACIGAGECVAVARGVFGLDASGRVVLLDPMSADPHTIRRAAERCPTDAVILEDERGEPIYP
ncbi:MAG TPA: ferredoxin [Chloroflexota bacterium]|nr:ferredoxin [Chloroflexota bacterium]